MAFYNPLSLQIEGRAVIVYPDQGLEKVMYRNVDSVKKHIETLYEMHSLSKDIDYQIIMLWAEDKDPMTDMWIFTKTDAWGSGPLANVKIFRGYKEVNDIGVGSGNTLIVLGREEEQRRKSQNLEGYLSGPRPNLPDFLLLNEDF